MSLVGLPAVYEVKEKHEAILQNAALCESEYCIRLLEILMKYDPFSRFELHGKDLHFYSFVVT